MCDIIQQQSVLINQLVLSSRNTERHFSTVSAELAALHETVESQSTSIVSTLTASLIGALRLAWQGQRASESSNGAASSSVTENVTGAHDSQHEHMDVNIPSPPNTPPPRTNSPLQSDLPTGSEALPVLLMTFIANIRSTIQDAK